MDERVTRQAASDAVSGLGWRYMLGTLRASVPVGSLFQGASVALQAVAACGEEADEHLSIDVRVDRVVLTLQTRRQATVTATDVELAQRIAASGLPTEPGDLQLLEIAVDAMDIAAVRPFWSAVLGYAEGGPSEPLTDPAGRGPAVWFQQMDSPRTQRNRIHLDISVAHDEAVLRVEAALKAGGRVVSDERAPSFWVLADPEGNEACISTWQGRD
ncbi:VOC family protein [Paractinoplanes lichenicola]|uniref:Putative pterin-4-alpha-carbinolamine dehydratase n=1 Tax=Paractinoplanes lichenicola TaxID=2802976 RepID=A0ABS1VS57_9ACTN|nr:VOC family protein [Actinoplanes lichenicola]MBL7257493.1 4a-hydroxytetrahydrobiopterin dehydratase [Actinoplanes lichenicola]